MRWSGWAYPAEGRWRDGACCAGADTLNRDLARQFGHV